jgi:outer membrane protein assembly factor BamD (BamD/ComL family)
MLVFGGCSLQKPSKFNKTMQNLTAHYNILFDANQILDQKQADYALAFIDSYNEILNVYPDTTAKTSTPDKDLQAAIDKANNIINFKDQSRYVGNAYLVLAKANFFGGQYFNTAEYCTYVIQNFPKQKDIVSEAREWKARALLYLQKFSEAKLTLDTALSNNTKPKKINPAGIYASKLQYDIDVQDYVDGEEMATQAIRYVKSGSLRLRWRFILAQLQELNKKNADAFANYAKIAKSDAEFEMAFNADLNRIRMEDEQNGVKLSRTDKLRSLLKNPNNLEFKDQIYYQIAQLQLADKQIDPAIKSYRQSINASVKNQNQKGLSYLRIADINFNDKANYIVAKKYYDSTLTTLSPNYPGYLIILKKTNNLQLLTDRLGIVAREDTLQMLARMDEKSRAARIDTMVTRQILQEQADASNLAATTRANNNTGPVGGLSAGVGTSSFYFYNSSAVSQGYSDFKRVWGNRKLEDNWRRSNRLSNAANQSGASVGTATTADPTAVTTQSVTAGKFRQQIVQNLPLTPQLLAQSNMRIYNAYFDIANFYRDILGDKKGAIGFYDIIQKRFPDNPNIPAVYYSMYRLYSDLNDPKAEDYKSRLLKNFPETAFAKVILDPDYSKKLSDKDAEANSFYSEVYDLYAHKKYNDVIKRVDEIMKEYPDNKFAAQLYYLKAIAAGHNETSTQFEADLKQIAKNYPNDRLITPLVNQHINYINANLVDMSARHFALSDADTTEVPFTPPVEFQKQTAYRAPGREMHFNTVAEIKKAEVKPPAPKIDSVKKVVVPDPLLSPKKTPVKPVPSNIFSLKDSTDYYFVVNISNDNTNLASSRFGIGQFNRANLQDADVKHQLMGAGDNNRLIYVGRFYSLAAVKKYARAIIPVMPEIMKIQKDKYTFFIITGQNLNKITDKKTLDSYVDYYQNNY